MGKLYGFLGLQTGIVVHSQGDEREEGRLPLRHHLRPEQRVRLRLPARQHEVLRRSSTPSATLNYAIVDEVDSILIDEARTPLIISGQGEASSHKYRSINEVIPRLRKDEHYIVDEKMPLGHAHRRGGRAKRRSSGRSATSTTPSTSSRSTS